MTDQPKPKIQVKSLLVENSEEKMVMKSLSGTTYDLANLVFFLYHEMFVCVSPKNWWQFINHRWHSISDGSVLRELISNEVVHLLVKYYTQFLTQSAESDDNDLRKEYAKKAKTIIDISMKLLDNSFKNKVMADCADKFRDIEFESKLNSYKHLIGFENGVFDLETKQFREGHPEDYISMTVGYNYQTYDAEDPVAVDIFDFLMKLFPQPKVEGEPFALYEVVLMIFASMLYGGNVEEVLYIFNGSGSNGKSKLMELMKLVFGDYAKTLPPSYFTQKSAHSSQASPEVAQLVGCRLVMSSEPEEGSVWNIGLLKGETGRDSKMCRGLYKNPFEFTPQYKLVFGCNNIPELQKGDSYDDSIWRRISIIPFVSKFEDTIDPTNPYSFLKDGRLNTKFAQWKSCLMYILIEYYKIYQAHGIPQLQVMKAVVSNYKNEVDAFGEFFEEQIDFTEDQSTGIPLVELWEMYLGFLSSNEQRKSLIKKTDLKKYLIKKGITCANKKRINHIEKRNVFVGLKIHKDDGEDDTSKSCYL